MTKPVFTNKGDQQLFDYVGGLLVDPHFKRSAIVYADLDTAMFHYRVFASAGDFSVAGRCQVLHMPTDSKLYFAHVAAVPILAGYGWDHIIVRPNVSAVTRGLVEKLRSASTQMKMEQA